ncbi:Uncharacterised protein [Escherichia coli]|nr:Uncharacterised protein [Escherichia coli]CAD6552631.1 Uncharacterised protein [Escherichia coli]
MRELAGIKEVKIKTTTTGKFHNMRYTPYMRHFPVIIFHFHIPECYIWMCNDFIHRRVLFCEEDQEKLISSE